MNDKTAPNRGALTPDLRPNPEAAKGGTGAMSDRTELRLGSHETIVREYLRLAARDLIRASRARIRYIDLARKYGMTWLEIGTELGVSDVAARTLYNRNQNVLGGDE